MAIGTTCVMRAMAHILHAVNEARFGESLPSGWECSNSVYLVHVRQVWFFPQKRTHCMSNRSSMATPTYQQLIGMLSKAESEAGGGTPSVAELLHSVL